MELHFKIFRNLAVMLLIGSISLHFLAYVPGFALSAEASSLLGLAALLLAAVSVPVAFVVAQATYAYAYYVYRPSPIKIAKLQAESSRMSIFYRLTAGNNSKEVFNRKIKRLIPQRIRDVFFLVTMYTLLSSMGWIAYSTFTSPPKHKPNQAQQQVREPIDEATLQRRRLCAPRILTSVSAVASLIIWIFTAIVGPKLILMHDRRQRFGRGLNLISLRLNGSSSNAKL